MIGHDMSWASFHALEVMASQKYPQKRVGYLAAVQSFRPNTDVILMAENLLKKVLITVLMTGYITLTEEPRISHPHLLQQWHSPS